MDEALSVLLSVHTLVFAVVCYLETLFVKKIAEALWPGLKRQAKELEAAAMYKTRWAMWWNEVALMFLPVLFGALSAGLASMYPYPANLSSLSGRVFFGMLCGFLSAYLVRALKKAILVRVSANTESELPPASS